MKIQSHVRLKGNRLELLGGDPAGRDDLHKLISTWAGWKRLPLAVVLPGGEHGSLYSARLWPSSIIPLLECASIAVEWESQDLATLLHTTLRHLELVATELDPPASHHAPLHWPDEWERKPMPHQVKAIRALGIMDYRALLADDMGLGKTATSLYAWQQSGARRLLIVCPKTVKRNWQREIWTTLKEVHVHLVDGTPKQRASTCSTISHVIELGNNVDTREAVIINYDLLHRLPEREAAILVAWCAGNWLILDESHYVKNRAAERTRFVLQRLAPADGGAAARLCLSGTPVRNTLEDLWSQVQIVRPGTWSSWHQFDKFHLVRSKLQIDTGKKNRKGEAIITTTDIVRQSRNVEQLNALMNTLQVRRKKEDVLDLPPKVFTYPEFELEPNSARIYKTMKDQALMELAELDDATPIFAPHAKSALEATLRLEQIAQGFLSGIPERYLEQITPLLAKNAVKIEGRPGQVVFPNNAKIEWLRETIDSIILQGGRPVVFSRFNTPMFWLVKQWEDAAMLHGGLSMEQRDQVIEKFQAKGISILFCQVKIAEGWNATASQDCILYGRDWSPAVNSQAVDRLHRIGQAGTVNVQIPIVRDTFEIYLHKKLRAKEADAEQALRKITIGELRNAL